MDVLPEVRTEQNGINGQNANGSNEASMNDDQQEHGACEAIAEDDEQSKNGKISENAPFVKIPRTSSGKLDKIHSRLETKKISGQEVDIEVTQWPDGEISRLRIFETGNSVAIFYEEYDKLEDVESPARDPAGDTKSLGHNSSGHSASFSHMQQNEKKHKRLQRLQLEDDEGIVSKHATFFPAKIKRRDSKHVEVHSDSYYDMSSFPRGTLTLLNVRNFRSSSGMKEYPRDGTDRDADGLCALFLELGFIVERYDNPTKKIMTSALEIAAAEEKLSCCACAILTHGDEGVLYATDQRMEICDITKLFRNKNLAGKPKLFLFQSCRSTDYAEGASQDYIEKNVTLPCEADFLYAYSTIPGRFSWKNSTQGSWFVQAICSVFRKLSHDTDAYRMLTRVNEKISQRNADETAAASIVSQMRKDFFFCPPYGPLPLI